MALTRAMLKGMGLTDEQVGAIIEEHTSVTTALKEQIREYKESADKLPGVQKELDTLKKDVEDNDWKGKYTKEHEEYEKYKTEVTTKEHNNKMRSAYSKILAECKIGDKYVDSILRVTDFSNLKLKDDGTLEDVESIKKKIDSDWSGFKTTTEVRGSDVSNPPGNNPDGSGKTGRAAELAAKYNENLYGKAKEG